MKRKVWELTVLDNPNRAIGGESDIFYTTDTEAFLIFRLTDTNFNPATATLTLVNTSDKSVISETVPVIDKEIEWEMFEEAIAHSGNWQAQLVYTQEKGGKVEYYTSRPVQFDVQEHLMTGRKPTLVAIEDWNTFMVTAQRLLDQIEEDADGLFIDIDELEQQYQDSEQARVEAEGIRETNESTRQVEESQRASSESTRVDNEQQREANESLRKSSETDRVSAEQNRVVAENERSDLYDLVQQKLENGEFVGEKGDTGDGLEYVWNGTQLGVRKEDETEYVYVDLKGPRGVPGEIDSLHSTHIEEALGYLPVDPSDLTWGNVSNKPTTFTPSAHTHSWGEITGKPTTFAPSTHSHSWGQISGKPSTFAPSAHTHDSSEITNLPDLTGPKGDKGDKGDQGPEGPQGPRGEDADITQLTKDDVGLGNVDNVKQMPISGGVLENYREKSVSLGTNANPTIDLSVANVFIHIPASATTYSIEGTSFVGASFTLIVESLSNPQAVTFPSNIRWRDGEIPDLSEPSAFHVLTFAAVGNGIWLGMYGGAFIVSG